MWGSEDNLGESVLSFYLLVPGAQTQRVPLLNQQFQGSLFSSLFFCFFVWLIVIEECYIQSSGYILILANWGKNYDCVSTSLPFFFHLFLVNDTVGYKPWVFKTIFPWEPGNLFFPKSYWHNQNMRNTIQSPPLIQLLTWWIPSLLTT